VPVDHDDRGVDDVRRALTTSGLEESNGYSELKRLRCPRYCSQPARALLRARGPAVGLWRVGRLGRLLALAVLAAAGERFAGEERVELLRHDMALRLPDLGIFDAIVSCFAIHHLEDERKRSLYAEVSERLAPGGVFANLEHVASPTEGLHGRFYEALGYGSHREDPSNRLLDIETQLRWLRELGLEDVDCYWKWLEMALLIGVKPEQPPERG